MLTLGREGKECQGGGESLGRLTPRLEREGWKGHSSLDAGKWADIRDRSKPKFCVGFRQTSNEKR